ncbi:MAG: TIGR00730 family Rossman fold protein [Paludibacteraceae bacterium]|nr:TIGR00730 family Rossman fold protein [Paludibacteraceae bacterium]
MNIAVYCSSSNHIAENYLTTAFRLGEWIAQNGHVLVFGGATGGSMSAVSEGVASQNGKIVGVIPPAIIQMNRQSPFCTELVKVENMSERKAFMKNKADAYVVLPGSYGTLDELFDVTASAIVGEHKKPVIILNENGFYNHLIAQIELMKSEKFIPVENFKPFFVNSLEEYFQQIAFLLA